MPSSCCGCVPGSPGPVLPGDTICGAVTPPGSWGPTGGIETGGIGTVYAGLAAALTITSPKLNCIAWSNWNGAATKPFADEDS